MVLRRVVYRSHRTVAGRDDPRLLDGLLPNAICETRGSRPGRLPTQCELFIADYDGDENSRGPAEKLLGHGGPAAHLDSNTLGWPNDGRVAFQIKPGGLFRLIDMDLLPPPA